MSDLATTAADFAAAIRVKGARLDAARQEAARLEAELDALWAEWHRAQQAAPTAGGGEGEP